MPPKASTPEPQPENLLPLRDSLEVRNLRENIAQIPSVDFQEALNHSLEAVLNRADQRV